MVVLPAPPLDQDLGFAQGVEDLAIQLCAYHRILKRARTIADLARRDRITGGHVAEAVQYRMLDRGRGGG